MWLRDTGVLNKMKYDLLNLQAMTTTTLPKVWKDKPLNLLQLGIILIVLVIGIVLSILVFLFEVKQVNRNKTEATIPSNGMYGVHS